jgi:RimJ/RimL family protein N-acetyltransferase
MVLPRTPLASRRIVLRPNAVAFVPLLVAAVQESLATVGPWMSWCVPSFGERDAREWYHRCEQGWERGDEYEFAVFDDEGAYVGGVGLNQRNRDNGFANLGYWIRESRQGRGYAAEAARLAARFGFRAVGLTRIEIVAAVANARSRRVAEKVGARFEGVLRDRLLIHGAPLDAAMYSLVRDAGTD